MSLKSRLADLYAELRRRRVLKASAAYIVMAWVLIEGAAIVFPALLLPSWTHRFVVVLGIIGFPVVVVLAWIFDLTPSGMERTSTDARQTPARIGPPPIESAVASIAVFPFDALSGEEDDHYLARAISAEVASALSHSPEVRVAPSRSTAAFDGSTELKNIGSKLDVQYVLTGNVRRKGKLLRILAELSDVRQGTLIWSEAYEREPADLVAVEENIAAAIVGSFGGTNLGIQIESARAGATSNTEARSLVYRARAYILDYNKATLDEAEKFARQAITLDPQYASAQAALASVLAEKVVSGYSENTKQDLDEALKAIGMAVELRPRDAFVLKLAGNVWAHAGHHDDAEEFLRRAIEIAPFDFGAWGYLGFVLATNGQAGDLLEAHSILDRIIEMAPQHPGLAYWMYNKAVAFTIEEKFEAAALLAKKAVDRQPGLAASWYLYANALANLSNTEAAAEAVHRASEANPDLSIGEHAAIVQRTSGTSRVLLHRTSGLRAMGLLG